MHLYCYGTVFVSIVLYSFLTTTELFVVALLMLELLSWLFQSVTLTNRLAVNLLAGSLFIALMTTAFCLALWSSLSLIWITLLFICSVGCFEQFSLLIQLYIFQLLCVSSKMS